jgi:hypothetical protein
MEPHFNVSSLLHSRAKISTLLVAILAVSVSGLAMAQQRASDPQRTGDAHPNTIFKHIDENGKVTYTNFPVKGGVKLDIDLVTVINSATPIPGAPGAPKRAGAIQPASAAGGVAAITVPAIDQDTQKRRDDMRKRILEQELKQEDQQLGEVKSRLEAELKTVDSLKILVAQIGPGKSQDALKAQSQSNERIASFKTAQADHERNIEAIKRELGAVK